MVGVQKQKIQWAIFLFLVMLYFTGLTAQAQYGGGSGEPNDPYLIYTAEQMNEIDLHEEDWDKHFKLMADIDLSNYTGTDFNVIGRRSWSFKGVFDGNGHIISNFSYTSTGADNIGLFGYVRGENAVIKDLGLIDPNVDAGTGSYVGSLVGRLSEGTITGCYVNGGSVEGDSSVGGLVGRNSGTISDCSSAGSVSGTKNVGGLVGESGDTITNCYSVGRVTGSENVGGLVGALDWYETITNCYSTGSVTGNRYVGGLVGYNSGTLSNCYSVGSVTGTTDVGGLVGENTAGYPGAAAIFNCYSTGSVSGDERVGGLVGANVQSAVISKCYSYGRVSGTAYVGGLVGYNDIWAPDSFWDIETSEQTTSAGGTGKTTAEMQSPITFLIWSTCGNEGIWTIDDGRDYPRLWWENRPGEPIAVGGRLSDFLTGAGTEDSPYLIYTGDELNLIGLFPCEWDKYFKLMADIDLTRYVGDEFNIIGNDCPYAFTGVFDGNGKKISNFSYTSTDTAFIGLFGYVSGKNAVIKDVGLIDPNIVGWYVVGSLVGYLSDGTISNCYSTGNVSSSTTEWWPGGVGGLVGSNSGTITNCYSTASVTGSGTESWEGGVGGLVGNNRGAITKCYSAGGVTGTEEVGGLVGDRWGSVTDSFWDIETSGQIISAGGTGLTTAEMQTESTFTDAGWDFVGESVNGTENTWSICEGTNYPRLVWQIPAGDFVCPDGITIEDFVFFIEHWRDDNCDISNDYCQGTDLDFSGTVDEADLEILVDNWLESSELEN